MARLCMVFPDNHIDDLLFHADDMCDVDVLRRALERVHLLHFLLNSNPVIHIPNTIPNPYKNVMHDSIQAFAHSLNTTVGHLRAMNLSLEDYRLGNSVITDMIERELKTLSFTGSLGHVQFDANKRERQTTVDILQIRNGTTTQVGSYDPVTGQLVLDEEFNPIQDDMCNALKPLGSSTIFTLSKCWDTVDCDWDVHHSNNHHIRFVYLFPQVS